jgi:hypothetical protein
MAGSSLEPQREEPSGGGSAGSNPAGGTRRFEPRHWDAYQVRALLQMHSPTSALVATTMRAEGAFNSEGDIQHWGQHGRDGYDLVE